MPYCKNCGNKLDNDTKFCPKCGTPVKSISVDSRINNTDQLKTIKRKGKSPYSKINLKNLTKGFLIDERYKIISKLGQGGFGAVYRAHDKKMDSEKALKVLPEAIVNDIEAMSDLRTEAKTMIALNHKHIIRVYDLHDEGKIQYIDMEYIDGKTLTEIKLEHSNKQVPEEKVREYALQIADGLAYAHSKNIIHKDIKPQNVMVNSQGQVKIMDFGIAETVRTSMSRIANSSSSGTLVYMSPEQIRGKNVGKESDIYSFGAMLYELLKGQPPFYRGNINYQIINEKPASIHDISENMNRVILQCLKKNYQDRYNNTKEIIDELDGNSIKYTQTIEKDAISQTFKDYGKNVDQIREVQFETEPAGTNIRIDGEKLDEVTPLTTRLTLKNHTIKLSKEGYKTEALVIDKNDLLSDFFIRLESIKGSISVNPEVKGMKIYFDGNDIDEKTPARIKDVKPGQHKIELVGKEYFSTPELIQINEKEDKLYKPLLKKMASIKIKSQFKDLKFKLDDNEYSKNQTIKLKPRKYKFEPDISFLPNLKVNLNKNKDVVIDYDNQLEDKILTIITGEYLTRIEIMHHFKEKYRKLKVIGKKTIKLKPDKVLIKLANKYLSKKLTVDLRRDDKKIDIYDQTKEIYKKEKLFHSFIGLFVISPILFGLAFMIKNEIFTIMTFAVLFLTLVISCIILILSLLK